MPHACHVLEMIIFLTTITITTTTPTMTTTLFLHIFMNQHIFFINYCMWCVQKQPQQREDEDVNFQKSLPNSSAQLQTTETKITT